MEFTKFVIREGRVASKRTVCRSELQPGLQQIARETLARLRSGANGGRLGLPGGPPCQVWLGTPPLPAPAGAGRTSVEEDEGRLADPPRSTFFSLQIGERVALFCIIPVDAPEHDGGRYGMIAGSWIDVHEQDWAENPEAFPADELQQQFEETARQTFTGRPALVCTWEGSNVCSRFADCLASQILSPSLPVK